MALPNVNIAISGGALGQTVPTSDGVAGLILSGVAVFSKIALLEPKQIFSLKQAEALGINESYDTMNTVDTFRQISDFYAQAGEGAELWIMLIAKTTSLQDALDYNEGIINKLIDASAGKIRILGGSRVPQTGYVESNTNDGFDLDAVNSVISANLTIIHYKEQKKPLVILIGGRNYSGTVADLLDLHTFNTTGVAVVLAGIGSTKKNAAIGLALGRLARVPVMRNIGRVRDGDLGINEAYLTNGLSIESQEADLSSIHDKGYIVFRSFVGKAGYFFTDDPTACSIADDLQGIARTRVINKAIDLAYAYFVNEINDEIPLKTDGTLETGYVKGLEAGISSLINNAMTSQSEISSVSAYINPAQNVLATNALAVQIRIVPVGYSKAINIDLGFENPLNN